MGLALDRLADLRAGDPLDPATDLGPLVHSVHLGRVHAELEAKVAVGGVTCTSTALPERGHFLAPTLLTGVPAAEAQHEVFGPVATVHAYNTLDEALALANGTPYGLEGYVLGADTERAHGVRPAGAGRRGQGERLDDHEPAPDDARPAWGLSGLGEEGTVETIRIFTGARVVGVEGGFALHGK